MTVPWRRNEDDAKTDGERRKGEVAMREKDLMEKLEMEERVPVPKTWRLGGVRIQSELF